MLTLSASSAFAQTDSSGIGTVTPITIGESFTMHSNVLGEVRRINVYMPPVYSESLATRLRGGSGHHGTLYMASSRDDVDNLTRRLAEVLAKDAPANVKWHYEPMPNETHATIYAPAALKAIREVFKP